MPTVTDKVLAMSATERAHVVLEYAKRRALPKAQRGNGEVWARERFDLSNTDVYNVVRLTAPDLIGGGVENAKRWLEEAGHIISTHSPNTVVIDTVTAIQRAATGFTLDGALLEQMIRAEVSRVVTTLKGEIENHVRKETQAAVMRESERAGSTLMRSLASTLDAAIKLEVQRQLEEFTS
jgi:AAA+ superfamily predicted ATPase